MQLKIGHRKKNGWQAETDFPFYVRLEFMQQQAIY